MDLSLSSITVNASTVLQIGGEVDVYTAPSVRDRINDLLDNGATDLVVDLTGLVFIDSTGLGVLVAGLNRSRDLGCAMRVVCTQERVLKLLRITGLDGVFQIYATVEQALADAPAVSAADSAPAADAQPSRPADSSDQS